MKQRPALVVRMFAIVALAFCAISPQAQNAGKKQPARSDAGMAGMQAQGEGRASMPAMHMSTISTAERKAAAARLAAKRQAARARQTDTFSKQGYGNTATGSLR